eukprot:131360-Chlamydomonas_euryale.AAC.1
MWSPLSRHSGRARAALGRCSLVSCSRQSSQSKRPRRSKTAGLTSSARPTSAGGLCTQPVRAKGMRG